MTFDQPQLKRFVADVRAGRSAAPMVAWLRDNGATLADVVFLYLGPPPPPTPTTTERLPGGGASASFDLGALVGDDSLRPVVIEWLRQAGDHRRADLAAAMEMLADGVGGAVDLKLRVGDLFRKELAERYKRGSN